MTYTWKRLSAFILTVALILSQTAFAAGKLTVTMVSGKVGEHVIVEVLLTSDDVCSGNFNICYDEELLQLTEAQKGDGSWFGVVNEQEDGVVRVSFAQTDPLCEAVLCFLTFEVLAATPADGTAVTLDRVRLYDKDSALVSAELEFGSISRDCVWYKLSSGETVEQQGVRTEVTMTGPLHPAGGGFTLTYDPSVLQATDVLPLSALSGAHMEYNLDTPGEVRIAFAGSAPITGESLCAVIFQTIGPANSATEVKLQDVRAYDESADPLDSAVSNGTIHVVLPSEQDPKLWVVGGALEDDASAEISVVLQGRGEVCGGQFTLGHAAGMTAAVLAEPGVEFRQEDGFIHVSWAKETPSNEVEPLITVSFTDAVESPLTFGPDVRLYDQESSRIGVVDIRPGEITAGAKMQVALDDVLVSSEGATSFVTMSVDLADIGYFTDQKREQATPILAVYNGGKLVGIAVSDETVFNSGVAEVSMTVSTRESITDYSVFVLDDTNQSPLCNSIENAA